LAAIRWMASSSSSFSVSIASLSSLIDQDLRGNDFTVFVRFDSTSLKNLNLQWHLSASHSTSVKENGRFSLGL